MASSLNAVFSECPYDGEYDLKVGTSERGDDDIDNPGFCLMAKNKIKKLKSIRDSRAAGKKRMFEHLLFVFGGVAGIEECVDADDSKKLFDLW